MLELEAPLRTRTRTRCAPTPASAPHPLRSRAAPLAARPRAPPLRHPCSLLAPFLHPSCTLLAPFLHPSSAGAAGHAAAHSRRADRWRPKRQGSVCRRVRRSCAPFGVTNAERIEITTGLRGAAAGSSQTVLYVTGTLIPCILVHSIFSSQKSYSSRISFTSTFSFLVSV